MKAGVSCRGGAIRAPASSSRCSRRDGRRSRGHSVAASRAAAVSAPGTPSGGDRRTTAEWLTSFTSVSDGVRRLVRGRRTTASDDPRSSGSVASSGRQEQRKRWRALSPGMRRTSRLVIRMLIFGHVLRRAVRPNRHDADQMLAIVEREQGSSTRQVIADLVLDYCLDWWINHRDAEPWPWWQDLGSGPAGVQKRRDPYRSGYPRLTAYAASAASRDFPIPPAPVKVRSRAARSASAMSSISLCPSKQTGSDEQAGSVASSMPVAGRRAWVDRWLVGVFWAAGRAELINDNAGPEVVHSRRTREAGARDQVVAPDVSGLLVGTQRPPAVRRYKQSRTGPTGATQNR